MELQSLNSTYNPSSLGRETPPVILCYCLSMTVCFLLTICKPILNSPPEIILSQRCNPKQWHHDSNTKYYSGVQHPSYYVMQKHHLREVIEKCLIIYGKYHKKSQRKIKYTKHHKNISKTYITILLSN
jgi:hypothetical protein